MRIKKYLPLIILVTNVVYSQYHDGFFWLYFNSNTNSYDFETHICDPEDYDYFSCLFESLVWIDYYNDPSLQRAVNQLKVSKR